MAIAPVENTYTPIELTNNPQVAHVEVKDPEQTYPGEACNCYMFVRNRIKDLPRMDAVLPNSEPVIGGVVIEFFKAIKHVSIITEIDDGGVWVMESNYNHCQTGKRYIPYNKYSVVGFWSS